MSTTPSPPFLSIPGIHNFRDIGGLACETQPVPHITDDPKSTNGPQNAPRTIKRGLVYRSADPSRITADGLRRLRDELGVKVVFDLRSAPEIRKVREEDGRGGWGGGEVGGRDGRGGVRVGDGEVNGARLDGGSGEGGERDVGEGESAGQLLGRWEGVRRVWCPVFEEQDYSPEKVALRYKEYARSGSEGFIQAYRTILSSGGPAFRRILTHLAQPSPTPCLIHCTAGKDRTGVLIALVLKLCGVSDDVVADEYALTDVGLADLKDSIVERLLKNPALEGNDEGVRNMVEARRENMLGHLGTVEKEFGGVEGYVGRVCELMPEEMERVRVNLLVQ
ncbi:hypothetical protein LTR50_002990 [Elasticomyces elasticus]|nr:hypothetical protein LTR50_002990 [Elasticomyces elasticus]